jgi:hypothetical protein
MPEWWNSVEALSRLNAKAQIASAVLLFCALMAGFLTFMVSNRLESLRAEREQRLQGRAETAEQQLAANQTVYGPVQGPVQVARSSLVESASTSTAGGSGANPAGGSPSSAAMKRARAAKQSGQPRAITPEQRRQFVAFLKDKPRGRIGLLTVKGDGEAHGFALEIEDLLKEAGFETNGVSHAMFPREVPRGLILRLHNEQSAPAHAGSVQLALEHIGFPAPGVPSSQEPANSMTIVIGRNPDA